MNSGEYEGQELNELCLILLERNRMERIRSSLRSKRCRWQRILAARQNPKLHGLYFEVPKKWSKCPLRDIKIRDKQLSADILLIEIELMRLTSKTHTRVMEIQKKLGLRQVSGHGDNQVRGLLGKSTNGVSFSGIMFTVKDFERYAGEFEFTTAVEEMLNGSEQKSGTDKRSP